MASKRNTTRAGAGDGARRGRGPLRGPSRSVDDDVAAEQDRLEQAQQIIGYRFVDPGKLLSALTHRSFKNETATDLPHNEVLELLGDAVLSVVVVDHLVRQSVDADEGTLTERRAAHVSTDALAKASASSGLASLLRTSKGLVAERPVNITADVVEAVIGAIWLDAGEGRLEACTRAIARVLGPPPEHVVDERQNAKRVLQERLQRLFGRAPDYGVERGQGPNHAPSYNATVSFGGTALGTGTGVSKRAASEAAAIAACERLASLDDVGVRLLVAGDEGAA